MNFDQIILFSRAAGALVPIALLGLLAYAVYRSGSGHVVLARIWRLIAGKGPVSDTTIERYLQEQNNLNAFRYFSGIKPGTLAQTHKLIEWAQERDLDLRQVARSGEYFDSKELTINEAALPGKMLGRTLFVAMWIVFALIVSVAYLGLTPSHAYLKFKGDDRYLKLDAYQAKLLVSAAPLTAAACPDSAAKNLSQTTGFSEKQVVMLCQFFTSKERQRQVDKWLASQRLTTLTLIAVLLIPFVMLVKWMATIVHARRLQSTLRRLDGVASINSN